MGDFRDNIKILGMKPQTKNCGFEGKISRFAENLKSS